ncbi:hypothetical protein [Rhodococcus opacus]|uniref:hypothetical protein n=1 Tax=Rhodococcus opacus TaxID=37919 RepID=UPI001009A3BA|nr:hypothetical protein [Rhodococcus opacus]
MGLTEVLASGRHLEATAAHVSRIRRDTHRTLGREPQHLDDSRLGRRFAAAAPIRPGLEADHDAVRNGLSHVYNVGADEGHVNRIKMLKTADVPPRRLRKRTLLSH